MTLAMRDFRFGTGWRISGTFIWSSRRGHESSIGFRFTFGYEPTITLHYRWRDLEDVESSIRLQSTPTQFDGERLWFTCPLVACNRRAGKLHLPPGEKYFGCRTCHNLTYRSCQEAHQDQKKDVAWLRMRSELDALNRTRGMT